MCWNVQKTINSERFEMMISVLPYCIVGALFLAVGIYFAWRWIGLKRRCTCYVDAVCVKIDTKRSHQSRNRINLTTDYVHSPVFQYEYQGELYTGSSEIYLSIIKHYIGCGYMIAIDPEHPEVLYEDQMGMIQLLLGLAISGIGIFFLLSPFL